MVQQEQLRNSLHFEQHDDSRFSGLWVIEIIDELAQLQEIVGTDHPNTMLISVKVKNIFRLMVLL
jgi:hypothetical protein